MLVAQHFLIHARLAFVSFWQGVLSWSAARLPSQRESWSAGAESARLVVFLSELFLVELPHACLGKHFDKQNFVRDSVFRNHSRIGEGVQMRLDPRVAEIIACLGVPDDQRQRPLAPFVVLDADDGDFRHTLTLRYKIFDLG